MKLTKISDDLNAVSTARRRYITGALVAPVGAAVSGCGGSDISSADTQFKVGAGDSGKFNGLSQDSSLASSQATSPAPVAANPLRNYVYGPVPLNSVVGAANVGIGHAVLKSLTSGFGNTAAGDQALWQQTVGINCVAVGYLSMYSAVSCVDCTAVGAGALQAAVTGVGTTAMGRLSCNSMNQASANSGYGDSTLRFTTTGVGNVAMGYRAAENNTTGSENVSIGTFASLNMPSGNRNVAVGCYAMMSNSVEVFENVAVGSYALANVAGSRNVALGVGGGRLVTSGQGNIFIGSDSGSIDGQKTDVVNSIAIGDKAITTDNNQVVIGNNFTQSFVLGGITITREQLTRLLALVAI